MDQRLKKTIQFIVFLTLGILLMWWVYSDMKIEDLIKEASKAKISWILLSLLMAFLSHLSRARRWNILIEGMGYKPKLKNTMASVLIMYLSNTVIPRSGELTRCGIITRYDKVPFAKLLGTVVIERAFDFIMLFLFMFIVLATQLPQVQTIIDNNPGAVERINSVFNTKVLIILSVFFVLLVSSVYVFRKKFRETKIYKKIKDTVLSIIEGLKSVLKMKNKYEFIFHTLFIWTMYFLMIYITFWSFEFTENLGVLAGLTIFVMTSLGMVFPSPGGIGSWHFMAVQTLYIYGITNALDAKTFAAVAHGGITVFNILLGIVSFMILPVMNKNSEIKNSH